MKISKHLFLHLGLLTLSANAQSLELLEAITVTGKAESLIGKAATASKGQASAEEIAERPFLRRGELLEIVPGVIITQHSGDGKANQYFVRGFNLDHGTDFSLSVDGQPINFVTHGHGQGYADLNPIIPELVEQLDYWKGPFHGQLGDLSTAGAAKFRLFDMLPQGIATFGFGEHNYYRGLLADTIDLSNPVMKQETGSSKSPALAPRSSDRSGLTYALEYNYYDGPWERESNSQRINGFLKYFRESGEDRFSITAMGYDGEWESTDQVPNRAIESGLIDRLGNIDDTVEGESSRYSLMAEWNRELTDGRVQVDAYIGYYDLDLFSNFTYFTKPEGDQFEQTDQRVFVGGEIRREWEFGKNKFTLGLQTRHDFISDVGLYDTVARKRLATTNQHEVYEANIGLYATADYHVNEWFRVQPGLRADGFHFDVESDDPADSGTQADGIVSPKLNLIFGPWAETEIYASAGMGFHSNDARGVTLGTGAVDPLVRTYGYELGVRTEALENVVSTVALFYLHSDSELVYIGDAGTSEAGPATERYGIEWSTYWRPYEWLMLDNEITLSEGKAIGVGDDEIPGSVPLTINAGVTFGKSEGFFGSLRGRYFGARPLIEDGSVDSKESFQVNARVGYRKSDWEIALDCLNLLDRDDNDIEYYYESQLPGEATPVEDIHLHPAEPRTFRVSLTRRF